jgi:DNA-binding MarR family transcriptional regulator
MGDGGADRDISLLFDVFVVHQRVRALLARALSGCELRADEYAVYSVLFERGSMTPTQLAASLAMPVTTTLDYLRVMMRRGHVRRAKNPADGRSYTVSLTIEGLSGYQATCRHVLPFTAAQADTSLMPNSTASCRYVRPCARRVRSSLTFASVRTARGLPWPVAPS